MWDSTSKASRSAVLLSGATRDCRSRECACVKCVCKHVVTQDHHQKQQTKQTLAWRTTRWLARNTARYWPSIDTCAVCEYV